MSDEEDKYIAGYCNLLRVKIQHGAIMTYHVKSVEQLTDSLSKAFSNSLCISVRDEFGSIDIHKPTVLGSLRNDENAK